MTRESASFFEVGASPGWLADFSELYQRELAPKRRQLERRSHEAAVLRDWYEEGDHWADAIAAQSAESSRRWAESRARAIAVGPTDRAKDCGEQSQVILRCGCKPEIPVEVGCGQRWFCAKCRSKFYGRLRRRVLRATEARAREKAPRGWRLWGWRFLRLSVRSSGDLDVDRTAIVRGWNRLKAWLQRKCKTRKQILPRFHYVWVWEITPGSEGLGNVHAHVIAWMPFFDWGVLTEAWERATEGAGGGAGIQIQSAQKGADAAATYVAKYSTKGIDPAALSPQLAAKVARAFYGARVVSASRGFWVPAPACCRDCGQRFELMALPRPTRGIATAVLYRYGNRPPPFGQIEIGRAPPGIRPELTPTERAIWKDPHPPPGSQREHAWRETHG